MSNEKIINIKQLNTDIIPPITSRMDDPEYGGSKIVVIGKPGCFALGTKVLKYDGSVINVEKVMIGDKLMGDDSTPRNVLELCHNREMMYKIIIESGESVIVNENHILCLKSIENQKIDIVLKDYIQKPEYFKKKFKWYRTSVEFEPSIINLDPYLLGCFLGYNFIHKENIFDIFDIFDKKIEKLKIFFSQCQEDSIINRILNSSSLYIFKEKILEFLQDNNLFYNEHIPEKFKCNSRWIRLEILAGIIDSNGFYNISDQNFEIIQNSEKIIDDIIFIARSLGLVATKKEYNCGIFNNYKESNKYYKCFISGNISCIPCHIIQQNKKDKKMQHIDDNLIYDFKIEKINEGEYYGFILDKNHRFLLEDFSVVHNTGKTTLISSLLYSKKHIFPVGIVMSGSEDSNGFYRRIMPSTFVFNEYNEETIKNFIRRQKIAKQHLPNPWAVILLDDCTDDPRIFNSALQHGMYKRGRHWKMWYILSLQYAIDVKPVIRTNVDGIFILREPILRNRKTLWENYASIIPDFNLFCEIMDQVTDDYTALYIQNSNSSNDWQDCVFWYKADKISSDFKFGCPEYWNFHEQRYNNDYVDPLT